MTALTQRRRERESEEVAFQEVERPVIDHRLDRLASSANSLAATANKLLVVAIAFATLWSIEVILRLQHIITKGW